MASSSHPFVLIALLLSIFATAEFHPLLAGESHKPLHRLEQQEFPLFTDDMDVNSLIEAARHQAAYLKRQKRQTTIQFGNDRYATYWLLVSVRELLAKLAENPDKNELNRFLSENYLVYQAGGRSNQRGRNMLVTGYYEPFFSGSLTRKAPFLTPIYTPPDSLVVRRQEGRETRIGRYDRKNRFVDFWSRAEIENNDLLRGYELAYLKDPFDAFLLHVQGSGRIQLPDGSVRSVRFAGSNGLDYKSIGKLLVDKGILALEDVNVPAIRKYLHNHQEERESILHHNPRFIFFTWGDSLSPKGSSGEILTPGRSIAMDASALPGGTIGFLISRRPEMAQDGTITGWQTFSRFVFPQDSGAAIKGTGRVDIFWGHGHYAEVAANHMKEEGKLYFLVKKGYPLNR